MTTPVLQLEEFFLTKFHVDFSFPPGVTHIEVKQLQSSFNYETGTHMHEPNFRMLKFMGIFQELDDKDQHVGHRIEFEMVGFFSFTEATPKGKEEILLRINGISLLYGALRGILASTTGVFPGGRFRLPNIMPQEIVADIERRRTPELQKTKVATGKEQQVVAKPQFKSRVKA